MADAILSVELQAKVDAFVKGLLDAANESRTTGEAVFNMSTNISKNVANVNKINFTAFQNSLKQGQLSLKAFETAGKSLPTVLPKITTATNTAAFALTNLGRVAQDAPFGFIGIQNNLNPLLESFQRLRAETGSNGAALKALGQSLIGPAGIGIALSVVSSAILLYQQYQQKANKTTSDAKKTTDDYIKSLDAVTAVQLKGSQNAQKELTDLSLLYSAYQNANLPLKERQSAYKQLQDIYPQYFGNIKFEKEATDKTKQSYQELTDAILASARARAASDKITQNESRKLENEQKVIDLQKEQLKLRSQQAKVAKAAIEDISTSTREGAGLAAASKSNDLQGKINENLSLTNNLKTDSNKLTEENARLVTYVNTQLEKGAKLQGGFGAGIAKAIKVKPTLQKTNTNTLGALPELLGLGDLSKSFTIQPKLVIKPVVTGLNELLEIAQNAENAIDKIVSLPNAVNLAATTLGTSFEAMGTAIAEGGDVVSAAGQVLQSAFADLLSQLGQQFITMGAAKVAAGILATPFGGKLIADGAGLIALGAGLSLGGGLVKGAGKGKASGGVTAFADGGVISGPTLGLMGEYAGAKSDPEVVAPLSKLKRMLGQQDGVGNAISSNAGVQEIKFDQRVEIDGTKLVILTERIKAQQSRVS